MPCAVGLALVIGLLGVAAFKLSGFDEMFHEPLAEIHRRLAKQRGKLTKGQKLTLFPGKNKRLFPGKFISGKIIPKIISK